MRTRTKVIDIMASLCKAEVGQEGGLSGAELVSGESVQFALIDGQIAAVKAAFVGTNSIRSYDNVTFGSVLASEENVSPELSHNETGGAWRIRFRERQVCR